MTKRALILQIGAVTVTALIVAVWWAFVDVFCVAIFMMTSPGMETDMDIVRYIWHFRLVQPEWLSGGNSLLRWQGAEAIARTVTVFLVWLAVVAALLVRYHRNHRRHLTGRSSQPLTGAENYI